MLALASVRSDGAEVTRELTSKHQRFVFGPDDPVWGRQTEQALREFFRSRSANQSGGIEITSVSCRSAGCEVQAEVQMQAPSEPVFTGTDSETTSVGRDGVREDPREALEDIWPLGPSLRRADHIGSDLFENAGTAEKVGFVVWYNRMEPKAEAPSPGAQSGPPQ
jgi:hypothetical protein